MIDKEFKNWLIDNGYKEYTPSGLPSTVFDYVKRINFIINEEDYSSWEDVINNIDSLIDLYCEHGAKSELGKKSHNSVISALRRFKEFLISK